jgi:hypothetical protein
VPLFDPESQALQRPSSITISDVNLLLFKDAANLRCKLIEQRSNGVTVLERRSRRCEMRVGLGPSAIASPAVLIRSMITKRKPRRLQAVWSTFVRVRNADMRRVRYFVSDADQDSFWRAAS